MLKNAVFAALWKPVPWDSLLILLDFLPFIQILQYMKMPFLLYTSSHVYSFNHRLKKFCPLQLSFVSKYVYQFLD